MKTRLSLLLFALPLSIGRADSFTVLREWSVTSCQSTVSLSGCLGGTLALVSSENQQYGFAYDFTRYDSPFAPPSFLQGWVCQLSVFTPTAPRLTTISATGGYCAGQIARGPVFSTDFSAESRVAYGLAEWFSNEPAPPWGGSLTVTSLILTEMQNDAAPLARLAAPTSVPEPSSFALVLTALSALGVVRYRARAVR